MSFVGRAPVARASVCNALRSGGECHNTSQAVRAQFVKVIGLSKSSPERGSFMLATRLTEMFNVKYPIMLGGMAGVSLAEVVAAVSEAGGYGVLGAGNLSPPEITDELARV